MDHLFGMHAKFSEKLMSLPPNTHTYVCGAKGKKC